MKIRGVILIFIFACAVVFTFLTLRFTNHNLERTFRESSENTFYLLSFIVDHFLHYERQVETTVIGQLRATIAAAGTNTGRLMAIHDREDIHGVWIITGDGDAVTGLTAHRDREEEIIGFYRSNLKGKEAHTLIMLGGKPFFLVNTRLGSTDVLILADALDANGLQIERVLDALVASSNLSYFAIIGPDGTPMLFSTVYENFLPMRGPGRHVIRTPGGDILQIEESAAGNTVIAGFDMEPLARVMRTSNVLLLLAVLAFVVLEGILFVNYLRFERFRLAKDKEIDQLKEVSAISTGFAHEFRNSVQTLSLLADDLEGEKREIVLGETARMKAIMDSLRLLGTRTVAPEEIAVPDLLTESAALLDHLSQENAASIAIDSPPGLLTRGNRALLVTAISNIIKNSLEAGAKKIEIGATRKGREIQIHCRDDGPGIEKATRDKIFEPFFSMKGQSGIGLYLARRIVELHGGRIEVKSDGGTQFTVFLGA